MYAVEFGKEIGQGLLGDADTRVFKAHHKVLPLAAKQYGHDAAGVGIFDGVVYEIVNNFVQRNLVGQHVAAARWSVVVERDTLVGSNKVSIAYRLLRVGG